MSATPGTPTTSANPNTTTNTSLSVAGLSTTVGDVNVVEITGYANGTAVNPTMTTPTGWTKVGENMQATGTPATWVGVYYRVVQSGDPSSQTFSWTNAGQMVAVATPWSGALTSAPIAWSAFANKAASNTSYAITGTVSMSGNGTLAYGFACRTSPGTWSGGTLATDTLKGATALSSGAAVATAYLTSSVTNAASVSKSGTGPSTSIGQQWAYVVADALSTAVGSASIVLTASGTGAGPGTTANASISLTAGGATVPRASGSAAIVLTAKTQTPAQAWLRKHAGGTQYVAHRDGMWGTYGEETLEGYTAAVNYHSDLALEISVRDTSDGVYVCSHDATTGRVFNGTNRTILSTAWSTFSPNGAFVTTGRPTTIVGGNVMRRIEEILDAFPDRIFVVENKHGTNQATLAALLEAHCPGRWIFKGPYNDTANANTSSANNGVPIWLYFYNTDLANLASTYAALSTARTNGSPIIFGLGDYSASPVPVQSDSDTFFAFVQGNALYSWCFIPNTATQKSTGDTQATASGARFDGYMISSLTNVIASDNAIGSASINLTASGAGRAAPGGSAAIVLTAGAAPTLPTTAAAAIVLTASGAARASSVAGSAAIVLTAVYNRGGSAGSFALVLTASGTLRGKVAATAAIVLSAHQLGAGRTVWLLGPGGTKSLRRFHRL